jgi:hypothetical protein
VTTTDSTFRRIIRRETHSPRTVPMVIVVGLLILALLYVGVEIVLALLSQPPLLVSPVEAWEWVTALPILQPAAAVVAGGVVLALLGLLLIVLAVKPGRLARHEMAWDGRAVVIDNGVIASAVAQRVSDETGVAREDISVGVSHRSVDVAVKPAPGDSLDVAPVKQLVEQELSSYQLAPPLTTRVRIIPSRESDVD